MKKQIVKATEAARSFSDLINRVRYHGQQFEIQRGRDIVARIVPAEPRGDLPVAELNQVFADVPRLDRDDAEAFSQDVRRLRDEMRSAGDAWD
jgi:antitoxin (DNA-binding transcriptional repressor) of toxin-antitoxin stability system